MNARARHATGLWAVALTMFVSLLIASPARAGEFPNEYYYPQRSNRLKALEGRPAPELRIAEWIGEAQDLAALRGSVVVVDFWATWCGPCMAAIPHNVELMKKYGSDGLMIVGVHDAGRGWNRAAAVVQQRKINYPVGLDVSSGRSGRRGPIGASTAAWAIGFWPTYFVIDRTGTIRAAGLVPRAVEPVVRALLAEKASPPPAEDAGSSPPPRGKSDQIVNTVVRTEWLEGKESHKREMLKLMARATPPAVESDTWVNSRPMRLDSLEGKVVLIDFWATWCGPCMRAVPKINALQEKYADDGFVVIGICHPRGAELMSSTVKSRGIEYAVCADTDGTMIEAYMVDSYPDYYLIDRQGRIRVADCRSNHLQAAIEALLAEEAEADG